MNALNPVSPEEARIRAETALAVDCARAESNMRSICEVLGYGKFKDWLSGVDQRIAREARSRRGADGLDGWTP